jgi:stearoyl-CoA desaturase (delta-9 desaturase)
MKAPGRPFRVHAGLAAAMIAFHLTALLAPWTFTWTGLTTAAALVVLTGMLGIGLGYHRLLCHRSLRTGRLLRGVLALLGVLACQRGPLTWCAQHRLHHRYSDSDDDPHLAHRGFLWAHVLWVIVRHPEQQTVHERYVRITSDLRREQWLCCLERHFFAVNGLLLAALFASGWLAGGPALALSLVVWGFFLRVLYCWHVTLLVNSINHRWGYRNYDSADNSRNSWWVALLSFGEGWHNNHHHRPRCAAHGHRWFELDLTYEMIRLLKWSGLARDVVEPDCRRPAARLLVPCALSPTEETT